MAVKLVQQQTQDSRSAAEICLSDVARMLRRSWRGEAVYMSSQTARGHILNNTYLKDQHITNSMIWTHSSLHWVLSRTMQRFVLVSPIFVEVGMWEVVLVHAMNTYGDWRYGCTHSWPQRQIQWVVSLQLRPIYSRKRSPSSNWIGDWLAAPEPIWSVLRHKYRALSGNQTVIARTYWQCELYNRCHSYTRCTL